MAKYDRKVRIVRSVCAAVVALCLIGAASSVAESNGGSAAPAGFKTAPSLGDCPKYGKPFDSPLHLRRYEDGSAWLMCGKRIIGRVSVPW